MSETSFVYPHISFVAILVAAFAHVAIGFLWYAQMTPTGRRWAAEMHVDANADRPGIEMLGFPISSLMAAWAVGMVIAWSGAGTVTQGILAGSVVGFAALAQALSTAVAGSHSMTLNAINFGYVVVSYAVVGAIVVLLS